jgi:hypothetical protein
MRPKKEPISRLLKNAPAYRQAGINPALRGIALWTSITVGNAYMRSLRKISGAPAKAGFRRLNLPLPAEASAQAEAFLRSLRNLSFEI